jgi:hypothetical protein
VSAVSRRSFFGVLGFAVAPAVPARARPAPPPIELLRCRVAGLQYHRFLEKADEIDSGTRLVLRREPRNPHDAKAIAVFTADAAKIGYVPRAKNAVLAHLMDAGQDVRAVAVLEPEGNDWFSLWMTLTLVPRDDTESRNRR